MSGWVKVPRSVFEEFKRGDDKRKYSRFEAYTDLLFSANYADVFSRGKIFRKGCVYRSKRQLADDWGWNRKTVEIFLEQLQIDGMIRIETTRRGSVIEIIDYNQYERGPLSMPP